MARHFLLTADGGSRGNPGPAGYGSVITENGKIVAELYDYIGVATNNVAEYSGLIAGLTAINEIDANATVDVKMDSKLVVEQMSGRWQIKHADMRVLAQSARSAHNPSLVSYTWIPRDENSHADRLANKALDLQAGGGEVIQTQQNYLTERLLSGEKATTIFLIRHGETILTPYKKFSGDGPLNPELTTTGLEQAEKVAAAVANLKPEVIIASPLKRTTQTAEALSRKTGLPIVFEDAWIECSFGIWDGLSIEEVKQQHPADYQSWISSTGFAPPGGESYDNVALRVDAALSQIAAEYPGQRVAVVTHNGTIKSAAKVVVGKCPVIKVQVFILFVFFSLLAKKRNPALDITVCERNPEDATFGFGIALQGNSWDFLREDDQACLDDIIAHSTLLHGQVITHKDEPIEFRTNRPNAGIERLTLLRILRKHAEKAGVTVRYNQVIDSLVPYADCDLVVGADGINSIVRRSHDAEFGTTERDDCKADGPRVDVGDAARP